LAPTSDQPLIAALDIGSSKVSALIATRDGEDRIRVLGTGQRESHGVKRGYVTDIEASEFAVREAVEQAERMSGVTVDDVWASYGAGGLTSEVANVEVDLGGHQIDPSDIEQLLMAGREAIDRGGKVVLHAHPALYTIDGAQEVQQPVGLHADRLGVDIHVIAADAPPLRNVDYIIRAAHLGVKAIVASPIAAALACLSEEERELGVALVELGAGVTNVSLHYGGILVGLRSVPLGAKDISDDIAATFGVNRRDAERLKCFYGSAMTSPRDNHELIDANPIGAEEGAEPIRITRAQLMMVIRHRVEELTGQVDSALKELGFSGPVGRPVVLTGGGAELKNIADYMQGVLGRTVRVGRPRTLAGLPDAHSGPAFSTLVGLACLAASRSGDIRDIALGTLIKQPASKTILGRFISAMKRDY
jgi:cell division protein FtsA